KPTLAFNDPYTYIHLRYEFRPEDFDEILAAMNRRQHEREQAATGLSDPMPVTLPEIVASDGLQEQPDLPDEAAEERAEEIMEETVMAEFMIPGTALDFRGQVNSSQIWDFIARSPDLHKLLIVQEWLAANNEALDLIVEASKKPVFVTPIVIPRDAICAFDILLPDIQGIRSFARGLQGRATIRVAEGDIDGAIEDILACYRLGRHTIRPGCLVQILVGIACEGIAHDIAYNDNFASQADAEQLKRLMDGLNNLPQRGTWKDGMEMERLTNLDVLTTIMENPGMLRKIMEKYRMGLPIAGDLMAWNGKDWNIVFRRVNEAFDKAIAGENIDVSISRNPLHYLTLSSRSNQFANIIMSLFLPAAESAREAFRRLECCDNMKRIQLAMFLYHAEHGTLPPTFSVDETTGKPLHSWRTLLLPYLGDEALAELYAQIRLDEPWDSEHNRPFHERNLGVYRCPSAVNRTTCKDGDSQYAVIVGNDLLFDDTGRGRTLESAGRYMLMLVERKAGICWMQPDAEISQTDAELGISGRSTHAPIGSNHTGGANFALRNGSIAFISETVKQDAFVDLVRGTAEERP
ncbi:MAG: DUF1559 domain-containing protein, partial [Planctomycetaceae bacterium]|nr:DUF1559 domain-containing protein [Planctomycetaceae bacterium]